MYLQDLLLSQQGANVNLFHDEKAPLTAASRKGELDTVVYLVQNGANFLYGTGPVHEAAARGHLRVVRYLHRLGANVEAGDAAEDRRPLWLAAKVGSYFGTMHFIYICPRGNRSHSRLFVCLFVCSLNS